MRFLFIIIIFFVFIIQMLRQYNGRPTTNGRTICVVMCANCACGGNLIVLWFSLCRAALCDCLNAIGVYFSFRYEDIHWLCDGNYRMVCNMPLFCSIFLNVIDLITCTFVFAPILSSYYITAVRQRRNTSMKTCECESVSNGTCEREKKYCGKTHSHQCGHSFTPNAE